MFTTGKPEGKGEKPQGTQSSGVHLSAAACNKTADPSKVTFWSSFSSVIVWLCAAYANIVLLLCPLSRQSYTDLVEPLIAAAVTLDPVYLKSSKMRKKIVFLCVVLLKFIIHKMIMLREKCNKNINQRLIENKPRRPLALCTMVQHTVSSPPLNLKEQTWCAWEKKSSWFLHSSLCSS